MAIKSFVDGNSIAQAYANDMVFVGAATGTQTIQINAGVTGVVVDANIEKFVLTGNLSTYKFAATATGTSVQDASGVVIATIPSLNQTATVVFADGSAPLVQTGGSSFTLGGAALASTATAVTAASMGAGFTAVTNIPVAGQTFTLTTGLDNGTAFTGGAGKDTFSGPLDSWSVLDELDGGLGDDTLAVATTATTAPVASKVTGIEKIVITTTGAGYTLNTTSYTGLTDLTVSDATAGAVALTGAATTKVLVTATGTGTVALAGFGGDVTVVAGTGTTTTGTAANALSSYSLTGGGVATINDKSGSAAATGSTLKTVTLTSVTDDANITANGITTLNVNTVTNATTVGDVVITAAAATRALTLNLNGVDEGAAGADAGSLSYTDDTATTLSVNSNTAASNDITVVAGAATTVNVSAAVALQLDALTAGVATAVNLSGSAALKITADTLASTAVITSTNTGGVTLTQALTASQQFVGSSSTGADSISLDTSYAKAVTTGAGNDTVIIGGAFATGGSVDAGDGDADVLSLTGALAANDSLSASSTFAGLISGFEILSLNTVASQTVDLSKLDNLSYVKTTGATALVLDKLASNGTVEITASSTQVTVQVTDANVGGRNSDVLNIKLNAATSGADVDYGTAIVANVETINIASTRSGTIVAADTNQIDLTVANAVTINVTGAVQADLDGAALTGAPLSNINASTNTGGLKVTTTGATQGILISGSATAANTVVGGSGGDVINGGSAADDLNGGAGADLIVGGAGTDLITGGTGVDTLTGGAGVDTFVTTVGTDYTTATADVITDFTPGATGDVLQIDISDSTAITSLGVVAAGNGSTAIAGNLVVKTMTAGTGVTLAGTDEIVVISGSFADSAALLTSIGTGAGIITKSTTNTTTNGLLVVWNDGSNTHVTAVSDSGTDAAMTTADLAATDLVVLTGVLTGFDTANFVAVA